MATFPSFEEGFWGEMAAKVRPHLDFKKSPSILMLGGGQWRFGKQLVKELNAKSIVYADDDPVVNRAADENQVLSTLCDVSSLEEIQKLGKYDMALIKGTYELRMAEKAESLEELFFAYYRLIKLRGKVVIFTRLRPTLPLPKKTLERWTEALPDPEKFKTEAEDCGFKVEHSSDKFRVSGLDAKLYADALRKGQLPFVSELGKEELEAFIKTLPAKLNFEDTIESYVLIKFITRMEHPPEDELPATIES